MNTLTLSIRQKFFDEILAGTKKVETREIRPNNFKRYCRYLHDGIEYEKAEDIPNDGNDVEVVPVKYDALKLITGAYNLPRRPYMVIKCEGADVVFIKDPETDEEIIYEVDGKEYIMAEIDFHLGEIIEKELYS